MVSRFPLFFLAAASSPLARVASFFDVFTLWWLPHTLEDKRRYTTFTHPACVFLLGWVLGNPPLLKAFSPYGEIRTRFCPFVRILKPYNILLNGILSNDHYILRYFLATQNGNSGVEKSSILENRSQSP